MKKPEKSENIENTGGDESPKKDFKIKESLLTQSLPPVSDRADDFIRDEEPQTVVTDWPKEPDAPPLNDAADNYRGTLDDKGNKYDPKIHAYPPEKTPTGRWKKLPKGKQETANTEIQSNAGYRREAQKLATLYGKSHQAIFGKSGGINSDEDLLPMVDAFEQYMLENGKTEIPAGMAVLLSCGLYSMEVCQREPNAAKLKKWFAPTWTKIKNLFGFGKKEKRDEQKETKNDAQSNSGQFLHG